MERLRQMGVDGVFTDFPDWRCSKTKSKGRPKAALATSIALKARRRRLAKRSRRPWLSAAAT